VKEEGVRINYYDRSHRNIYSRDDEAEDQIRSYSSYQKSSLDGTDEPQNSFANDRNSDLAEDLKIVEYNSSSYSNHNHPGSLYNFMGGDSSYTTSFPPPPYTANSTFPPPPSRLYHEGGSPSCFSNLSSNIGCGSPMSNVSSSSGNNFKNTTQAYFLDHSDDTRKRDPELGPEYMGPDTPLTSPHVKSLSSLCPPFPDAQLSPRDAVGDFKIRGEYRYVSLCGRL